MKIWFVAITLLLLGACGAQGEKAGQALQVAAGCNAAAVSCEATGAGSRMLFSMVGVRTMQPATVSLRWEGAAAESVIVSFTMVGMDMGDNRYRLLPDGQGGWTGQAVLPVCVKGRSDWVAEVTLKAQGGAVRNARFPLTVGP